MDLGATEWTTFRKITLPMIAPGVAAAALLAAAISIDDYVITSFNAGQTQTFPLFIFGATRQGVPPEVNVLASGAAGHRADPDGAQRAAAAAAGAPRDAPRGGRRALASKRRSRRPVPERTGLVYDERCFGHRNPPSGPAVAAGAAVRAARAAGGDVPRARGLGRAAQGRAPDRAQRAADRARARADASHVERVLAAPPGHGRARRRGVDRAGHAHRGAARGRRAARGGGRRAWRASSQRVRARAAARATTPRRRGRWASACSTRPRWRRAGRSASAARGGSRSSTGTSTTATAPRRSSATTRPC